MCGIAQHGIVLHDKQRYLYDLSIDPKKSTESSLLVPQGGGIPENEQTQKSMSDDELLYEIGLIESASHDKVMNHRVCHASEDSIQEMTSKSYDGNLSQDEHQMTSNGELRVSHSSEAQDNARIDSVVDEIAPFAIREITEFDPASIQKKSILLLYLNKDTFLDEGNKLEKVVQSAKDLNIDIILIHEDDIGNGGCPFSLFFKQAPQSLIDPPHELFQEMAISLYSTTEYRRVSMRKIIDRIFYGDSSDE